MMASCSDDYSIIIWGLDTMQMQKVEGQKEIKIDIVSMQPNGQIHSTNIMEMSEDEEIDSDEDKDSED